MSNSKHAHYRYNVLDRCFRRRERPMAFKEILNEVNENISELYPGQGISTRTLRDDIRLFRDKKIGFSAPIIVERFEGKEVYIYSDPEFSIAKKGLLPDEQYLIDAAQQLLERYNGHPKYDKLSEALVLFQEEEGATTIPEYHKILFYDKNEAYEGLSYLKPMFLAIKNKDVLKITFQNFNDTDSREYIFHPYILKQYNQRWFVFGYNETADMKQWSIPLDERLQDFEILKDVALKKDDTDWITFFNEMVGVRKQSVTLEAPISEKVVLRFSPQRLQYFKTKPIHPYWDEFVEKGKENQVFFEAVINLELIQQILSYGKDVEVLAPESLRMQMSKHVQIMHNYYV
ncbi:WYL domain-containing protein [Aequorivita sp. KMM 9714]|uniref:helix-turn-helix transcriptional regulator n=1 Tax=Aequorivita sp. KMM 9714 TaxID=2707173 RepID=UPI0013EADA81|nr:WYL domain-containing protein [Aequorivita sp. KMM 9714]NGX85289.1 WYL domain-containing protein [Aequorivita sp. KMM 9714]